MKLNKKFLTAALIAMSIAVTGCNDIAGNPIDEDTNSNAEQNQNSQSAVKGKFKSRK